MAEEANKRLKQAIQDIELELDNYRSAAVATENRYAVIGGLVGGIIGLVGGLVGVLATSALGAIIAKDMGGSWSDSDCVYTQIATDDLDLTDEQHQTMLTNRQTLKAFEAYLACARLTSSDYYRVKGIYEGLSFVYL